MAACAGHFSGEEDTFPPSSIPPLHGGNHTKGWGQDRGPPNLKDKMFVVVFPIEFRYLTFTIRIFIVMELVTIPSEEKKL